jgi:ferrochelatase
MKALVLMNMGGPRNKEELELFLRNMFNDKNILTIKSDMFRSMLASLIVFMRKESAWKNYEAIGGKSPINDLTLKLIDKLQDDLDDTFVTQVMRYTPPFAPKCVEILRQQNIKDIVLFPLYPQYSTTTTKSSLEDFQDIAGDEFNIRVIEPLYKNKIFNEAIIEKIEDEVKARAKEFNLVFSAHGLPQKIVDNGDPYQSQIEEHVKILQNILKSKNINFESISLAYQSKVGPMKWLEPSLDNHLERFKDKNVLIYPISFIIDNSETDFELSIEYKEIAYDLGIKEYKVCKCLNDSNRFVEAIKGIL